MEPQFWLGLGGLVFTVLANIVLVTQSFTRLGGKIDVINIRTAALEADVAALAKADARISVAEERAKHSEALISNIQQENLRVWKSIDDLRRGKGLIEE